MPKSSASKSSASRGSAPQPEPIRWFGTGWVEHDSRYWLRRVGVGAGALLAAVAGALLMRLAVQGVLISRAGSLVGLVLVLAVMVCSCVAALRTWSLLSRGRAALSGWMDDGRTVGPVLALGFVGALVAYFLRSLVEAPGEAEKRAGYELALTAARRGPSRSAGARPRRRR